MAGLTLRCPVCGAYIATDFVGEQFTHKCKCDVTVTVIIPKKVLDKRLGLSASLRM